MNPSNHEGRSQEPPYQPGPIYDRSVRAMAEADPTAFCDLLGEPHDREVQVISSSFAAETRYADFVGRTAPDRLVHAEYIRTPVARWRCSLRPDPKTRQPGGQVNDRPAST